VPSDDATRSTSSSLISSTATRAGGGQTAGNRFADSLAGPGHESDLSFQVEKSLLGCERSHGSLNLPQDALVRKTYVHRLHLDVSCFGMRLQDKVAIITGAGSGIGKATALVFADEGAKVVVVDCDAAGGERTVAEIERQGHVALFVRADISKETDAERLASETAKAFGGIDVLVNNAAIFVLKGFDATVSEWHQSLAVNVIGTVLVTKYVVDSMKKRGGGAVVNLASISSWIAQSDIFAYSATKAAVLQLTRNMAMDLAPWAIRVNCVCPGTIVTAAVQRYMEDRGLTVEQLNADEGAKTLLKRVGQPHEVARAILFLASDEASYITGTHLMVDGGYTAI